MKAFIPGTGTIDSSQKTISKPLTDLEKWKKLLDEMKVEYDISNEDGDSRWDGKYIFLKVRSHYREETNLYIQSLTILFNLDESFNCFECIGD